MKIQLLGICLLTVFKIFSSYERQQSGLTAPLPENEKKLAKLQKAHVDMRMLYSRLCEFIEVKKLTPTLINNLIQIFRIHNNDKSSAHCFVQAYIYFTAVSFLNLPTIKKLIALLKNHKQNRILQKPYIKKVCKPPKGLHTFFLKNLP